MKARRVWLIMRLLEELFSFFFCCVQVVGGRVMRESGGGDFSADGRANVQCDKWHVGQKGTSHEKKRLSAESCVPMANQVQRC
jgi:hypothetical protein